MSQISNYPISKIIADRIFEIFLITITQLKDKTEADQFISDLLTPTEKIMIAKRLAIAFLLEKKYDYRSIQKLLRVSTGTITAVNLARNLGSNGYKNVISKIIKKENLVNLFDKVLVKLLSAPSSLERGKSTWTYLKDRAEAQKNKRRKVF
ncbi:MAG: TrpR-like protein YerC/YecD [Candidatus Levybacteria bacterium]|nr:TrpR-like protein YerC/YecD [Candidatus Levybacteria bacterium]